MQRYGQIIGLMVLVLILTIPSVSVFATERLTDLVNDGGGGGLTTGTLPKGNLIQGLEDTIAFDTETEVVSKLKVALQEFFGNIVQFGAYVIAGGVPAICILDLIYILIPPLQPLLSRGEGGQAPSNQGMAGRMGGGMPMGMGMPMGRMGGGMPVGGGMPSTPTSSSKWKWVTNSAITAVAGSQTPDQNGKSKSALSLYWQSMSMVLITAPILLVLVATGILGNLGFAIGGMVGNIIYSILSVFS